LLGLVFRQLLARPAGRQRVVHPVADLAGLRQFQDVAAAGDASVRGPVRKAISVEHRLVAEFLPAAQVVADGQADTAEWLASGPPVRAAAGVVKMPAATDAVDAGHHAP